MKKLFALLTVLMMLLPAALADTVHLDAFTFELPEEDLYIQYEKTEGGVVLFFYPSIDWEAEFRDNINITWTSQSLRGLDATADEMAEETVREAIAQLEEAGVIAANDEILETAFDPDEGMFTVYYKLDVDYTPMGIDTQLTLYFYQLSILVEGDGTYIFTLTSNSETGMEALHQHLDEVMQPN